MGCGSSSTYVKDSTRQQGTASSMRSFVSSSLCPSAKALQSMDLGNAIKMFNNLESSIQTMEESKCFEKYRIITEDLSQLKIQFEKYRESSDHLRHLISQESNSTAELSLRSVVMQAVNNPTRFSLTLVELLNKQEINNIQLELIQKDIDNLSTELRELKIVCDQLQEVYQQRDSLLNNLFDGHYASQKESVLENELDKLLEERHYTEVAKIRWIHSDNLLVDALDFLDAAIRKMRQLHEVPENDLNYSYTCVQEARNNLILYHYNLLSVHNILNVKLPHITTEDLETMNELISTLFNDTRAKIGTSVEFASSMRTNTVTQHKWVKEVVNTTLKTDLLQARDKCRLKAQELRFERTMLIKQRFAAREQAIEHSGTSTTTAAAAATAVATAKHDSPFELRVDSGVDSELDESVMNDEQLARIFASGKESITSPSMSTTTPLLPGEVLAPLPSNKEIFGKIIQLRTKHQHDMQEFEQNQRLVRVKMSQGLREKLNHRRSRRSRMEMHRRQLEALQESPLN